MKKFTKLLLALTLCVLGVGSAQAEKVSATPSTCFGAEFNSSTNTMTWDSPSGWHIIWSNLPAGDITKYTKFHATLSNFSDNANYIRLVIKDNSEHSVEVRLEAGENNVDLQALSLANPTCDFADVADITFWGGANAEGKEITGENKASVVIENVYMFCPTTTISAVTGFGDEITSLDYIVGGNRFVISDGTNVQYFSGNQDAKSSEVTKVPTDGYFYYTLTKISGLDLDNDEVEDDDIYAIYIINEAGKAFPAPYGLGNNVNFTNWGSVFSGSAQADKGKGYGTDAQYQGIWKLAYSDGAGFSFKNCSLNKYLKVNGSQDAVYYLKLYKSLVIDSKVIVDYDKIDNAANDDIFALSKATGYNAETGVLTNGTWTFETPVDISDWDYLMITTVNTAADASHEITITDDNGTAVGGEGYSGSAAGTGGNMWLDRWNNQNSIRISIDYLRINKSMDISKIKSLKINGTTKIANVYLTDNNNTKIKGGYCDGDLKREYSAANKYGTVCLPFVASYAGAEIYSIASAGVGGISLEKVTGLLEAGKPYFYVSADENGKNNEAAVCNVNFFRADLNTYDVSAPVENNGLIGTYTAITAPAGTNYLILSANKLWNTEGCTGDDAVNIGANKAYIDKTKIVNKGASARLFLPFGDVEEEEVTGIQTVKVAKNNGIIFNLNGQRMNKLTKGLNIIAGKKVLVK